jgi:hypothetical protein
LSLTVSPSAASVVHQDTLVTRPDDVTRTKRAV